MTLGSLFDGSGTCPLAAQGCSNKARVKCDKTGGSMEKKKTAKPMTAREKKERAKIRKDLREQGILPPKKKPLNRKAFAEKAKEALKNQAGYTLNLYLLWALLEMLEKQDYSRSGAIVYSQEAVGAAKVVLLAVRRMEFEKEKAGQSFTNGELYEAVKDIYEA